MTNGQSLTSDVNGPARADCRARPNRFVANFRTVLRVFLAVVLWLSPPPCRAQGVRDAERAPDEAYTARLVRLVGGLQKNPWRGWKAGTVVVVRYIGDDASGTNARAQPDTVYKVLEADKLFEVTQEFKGKRFRREFLVKDQPGLPAARVMLKDEGAGAADLEVDGYTLNALLSESRLEEFPGGTWVTREWFLAGHPSILLRQETAGEGWRVTSAKVSKKIGGREFECVEIKSRMRFHSRGTMEDLTTRYLSPEVPGHLVEEVKEVFKVGEKGVLTPYMVSHLKAVELKIQ